MIFIDEQFIGGYSDLYKLVNEKKIDLDSFKWLLCSKYIAWVWYTKETISHFHMLTSRRLSMSLPISLSARVDSMEPP